jgi:ribonucleotide reductase beta subunit family protein with ferritin-like domain
MDNFSEYQILSNTIKNYTYIKNELDNDEPLLQEEQRFCLFPIKHYDIWELQEKQASLFWRAVEIDFSKDLSDWESLDDNTKFFIKNILAFFAGSDSIVNLNIMHNFTKDISILEAQHFYQFQSMMENEHSLVYSLQIETLIKDEEEKNKLFNALITIPCITNKMKWCIEWLSNGDRFAKRLIAFAIVEGIFFSGSFCAIYWIKEKNILPGLTTSNEFISRDEGLHCEFACLLYSKLINKLNEEEIHDIISKAVEIEKEFITESLPCKLIGMNSDLMKQYIEFVADRLLNMLGYNKIYNSKNPFQFMEKISIDQKTNFFERRVTEYAKVNLNKSNSNNFIVNMNLDF